MINVFNLALYRNLQLASFAFAFLPFVQGHNDKVYDRSPTSIGKVLVFGGTGWYRHPETAAINGWLSRLSDELKMQVDVTESAKDISNILSRYQVLILNNSNQLTKLLDQKQRKSFLMA